MARIYRGVVKFWNPTPNGWGILRADIDGSEHFCHFTGLSDGVEPVRGAAVQWEVTTGADGRPRAAHVQPFQVAANK